MTGSPTRRRSAWPSARNPFSAVGTGAGANLLRSTGFFDGAGSGEQLLVLALWAVVGLVCLAVPALRARRGGAPVAEATA